MIPLWLAGVQSCNASVACFVHGSSDLISRNVPISGLKNQEHHLDLPLVLTNALIVSSVSLCAEHANLLIGCHCCRNPGAVTWILKWDGENVNYQLSLFIRYAKCSNMTKTWIFFISFNIPIVLSLQVMLYRLFAIKPTVAGHFPILFAPVHPIYQFILAIILTKFYLYLSISVLLLECVITVLWYILGGGDFLNSRLFTIT